MSSFGVFLLISLLMEAQYVCSQKLIWPCINNIERQLLHSNHHKEYTYVKVYHQLSDQILNQSMDKLKMESAIEQCNDTRLSACKGIPCQECKDKYSLAIGSNECFEEKNRCSGVHLLLLIFFAAAGFLLVFFIKLLNMTVSQGTINGLIFYANIVWAYQNIFFPKL